jgi:Flp pilus assembly protein TadD
MGLLSRLSGRGSGDGDPRGKDGTDNKGGNEARARALFERGKKDFFRGRYERAAETLAETVRLAPHSADSQFLLGAAHFRLGQSDKAVGPLRQCVDVDPDHGDAHNALGMTLGRLELHDEAEVHLARAAYLGHVQAPDTLATLRMDFCRTCAAPVHFTEETQADIVIVGPGIGWRCVDCRRVACGPCVAGSETESTIDPRCPACHGDVDPIHS